MICLGGGVQETYPSDSIILSDEAGSNDETSTPTDLKSDNFDSAIASGGSLKLSENITTASNAVISNDTILDLYGHTLTFSNASDGYGILVNPGATLTITDTSGTTGSIKKVIGTNGSELAHPVILIGTEDKNATNTEMATLNLQKCNIQTIDANGKSSTAGYGVYAANYSQVTAGKDVEIIAGYSAISGNGNNQGASITITGGKYTSETSAAIFFPSTTTLEVTGGTFIGKTGFDIRAGTVTISDAVISLNKKEPIDETGTSGPSSWGMGVAVIDKSAYASGTDISVSISNTTVTGATYDVYIGDLNRNTENGAFKSENLDEKITSLNHKISLEIKDDEGNSLLKYAAESGSSVGRIISSIEGVIEVNSVATLQNAIEVCSGTIKLTKDIDFSNATAPLKFDKKATLDLNGKTLTIKGDARIEVVAGGDLTITDSSDSSDKIGKIEHTVTANESSAISVTGEESNVAKLTLDKCEITVSGSSESVDGYGIFAAKYSEITSGEGVTITAGYSAISGHGTNPNVDINITGGEYTSNKFAAIYFPCVGNLTISGGSFTGLSGIEIRAGDASISNATITATGKSNNTVAAFNQPTNWGMGIVVFDHQSYANGGTSKDQNEYLDINVFINNVTFKDNPNFDIYVGKHPLDANAKSSGGTTFVQNNEKTVHDINIVVNDVDFEGKGLYLYGANDVEITNCNFKNINTSADSDKNNVNAIYLWDCRGSIIIGGSEETGNTIENVPEISSNALHYGRGIFIYNCDTNHIMISHNEISNIAYNAIQIVSWGIKNEPNLYIAYNTIENWDADKDSVETGHVDGYAGGRAVRIDIQKSYAATIINNTFSKDYEDGIKFASDLGSGTEAKGYDNGNVLKLSAKSEINSYNVILDLDGNKLNGKVLEYNNDKQVILDVDAKATFSNDPKNLYKIGEDDATVGNLIKDYELNPTDGGYTFHPTGTLQYVTGYTGFSSNAAMQSGYYLPFRITFDKSNNNLTNLSVTLSGNTDKTVGVSALDSKGNEENAYMDVVFFIGSLSSIEITVDTDKTDNTPGVTYVIYLGGLVLEQSVITAPLVDNSNVNNPVTPDDYKVEMSLFYSNVFVLNVTAHDLVPHHNGENKLGYWVGVAIPVPAGIDISKAKYSFIEKPIKSEINKPLSNSDLYSIGDKNYVCFYSNVDADKVNRFIAVDWDGSDGSAPPLYYFVNFDAIYTSDEFKPAPLVDHATKPGKEIKLEEYSVKVGTAGITTLYLTAKDVPNHVNGANTSGYWVGIGFKAPKNADFDKAQIVTGWGRPYASIVSGNYTEGGFDSKFTDGEDTYFTTYYNVGSSKYQDQAYIMIYWNGFESTTVSDDDRPDIYLIDFTNVSKKSSSGSGGGVPVTPPVTPEEPKEPIIPDSKGNAEIKVDEEKADKLVQETVTSGSKTLELINKDSIEGTVTSVTVAVEDLKTISDKIENNQNINSVSIATSAGEVIIEKDVLSDILANTDAETIVVEVVDAKDQLNEEQKKVVGDNPVYDINIRAGSEYITNFNGNSITISIPYELQPGEDPNNLVVYYLKDDGTVEKMKGTYKDGKVSFETNHLSKFVIAYEAQEPVTPDNPDKPTKEDNDNTLYYIVAAIVVILIIVALAYYFVKKKQ